MTQQVVLVLGVLVISSVAQSFTLRASGCSFNVKDDLPSPQPLLLTPGGNPDPTGFLQPNSAGVISLQANQQVLLACSGVDNYLTALKVNETIAKCVQGHEFSMNGVRHSLNSLSCSRTPQHELRLTDGNCYNNSVQAQLGFPVVNRFYTITDVCFNTRTLGAIYSHAIIVAGIKGFETGVSRPNFTPAGMYGSLSPETLYKRATQLRTFTTLLGSEQLASMYVSQTSDYFLSKGHLAAKADFVFGSQQRSTFYYANAAPQWQTFNGGNWAVLEQNVQDFAGSRGLDLHVYTGTHGVVTLPDVNNNPTQLFLHVNGSTRAIPVPQFFWKVVYHPETQAGVVFVGVNNPYEKSLGSLLCPDVCAQVSWVSWEQNNVKRGLAYCCKVDQFRAAVAALPAFPVSKLLT